MLAIACRSLQPPGVPETIRYRRPDGFGFDEFKLAYPDRSRLVGIMLDPDGTSLTL